jgi:hypothetical protein
MDEEWKPISDLEGFYEVSSFGRVRSVDHELIDSIGRHRKFKGRVLIPKRHNGYVLYILSYYDERITVAAHILVLQAFKGPCPEGMQSLHDNDIKDDNWVGNLRWGTPTENMQDMVRNGGHWQTKKTQCPLDHDLVAPNLVPSHHARKCRACSNASWQRKYGYDAFVAKAHANYKKYMEAR